MASGTASHLDVPLGGPGSTCARCWPAGLLAHEVRSQAGLQGLLADHFGVPVRVEPLVGRWLAIPDDQRKRIGSAGASRTLGSDAVLGARWHDPQAAVGIRLGPMGIDLYRSFLPADPVTGDPADGRARVGAARAGALLRRRGGANQSPPFQQFASYPRFAGLSMGKQHGSSAAARTP